MMSEDALMELRRSLDALHEEGARLSFDRGDARAELADSIEKMDSESYNPIGATSRLAAMSRKTFKAWQRFRDTDREDTEKASELCGRAAEAIEELTDHEDKRSAVFAELDDAMALIRVSHEDEKPVYLAAVRAMCAWWETLPLTEQIRLACVSAGSGRLSGSDLQEAQRKAAKNWERLGLL